MTAPLVPLGDILELAGSAKVGHRDVPVMSITMHGGLVDQSQRFKKRIASREVSGYKAVGPNELVVGFPIDEGVLGFQRKYPLAAVSPAYDVWQLRQPSAVYIDYLERFLRSPLAIHAYRAKMRGSVGRRRTLSKEDLRAVRVPLPSIREQKRIAMILEKADALRAKRLEAIAGLDQLFEALFLDMFGDPVTNPKGWPRATFGDLLKVKSGNGLTAKNMKKDGAHPVYGGNGLSGHHDEYMFEESQIVIGRVGAHCGVVHRTPPRAWVTDNALYVSSVLKPMNLRFIQAALTAAKLNRYAGRSAQPLVSGNRIYPVKTILPPRSLQDEYETRTLNLSTRAAELAEHRDALDLLFSSLQERAFRGEV